MPSRHWISNVLRSALPIGMCRSFPLPKLNLAKLVAFNTEMKEAGESEAHDVCRIEAHTFTHMDTEENSVGNILEGLTLYKDVVSEEFQTRLVDWVKGQIELGKAGELVGKTYLPPEQKKWAKLSKSRLLLQ